MYNSADDLNMKTTLIIIFSLLSFGLIAQCYPDRHSTNITDSWLSCTKTASPNPANGDGYWIMYDLGAAHDLYNVHIWNINHPDFVTYGFKKMKIELSQDGVSWLALGSFDIPKALSSSFYEGYRGINFDGINAQYVLITGEENFGGTCFGLGEIKIYTSPQDIDDWNFAITVCETDGIVEQLSFGENLNGEYAGGGVVDKNNGTFDFDANLVGPGLYNIKYTYNQNGMEQISMGSIEVLSCETRFCGDCFPCDNYSQAVIDGNPIPLGTYSADSVASMGTVNPNSLEVNFRGEESVLLNSGFTVEPSRDFTADIRDCQTNLIQNPSFEGSLATWSSTFSSTTPGTANWVSNDYFEANNAALIDVTTASANDWRVQFKQSGIELEAGEMYEFSFAIKGDVRKVCTVRCYTSTFFVSEIIDVDPFWNHHTFTFQADNNTSNCIINFQLGATPGLTYIDHVKLVKVD